MKRIACVMMAVAGFVILAEGHEGESLDRSGFRESFLKAAFPLTREFLEGSENRSDGDRVWTFVIAKNELDGSPPTDTHLGISGFGLRVTVPPMGPASASLEFDFPVSGPEERTLIDPTPPNYFKSPPPNGATTILG